jgi:hypothetical protein
MIVDDPRQRRSCGHGFCDGGGSIMAFMGWGAEEVSP